MKGYEITKQLSQRRRDSDQFIKWWRKENDFLDYDLIDRFMTNFKDSEEIYGFDLLSTEEMWDEIQRICGDRISRTGRNGSEFIVWLPPGEKTTRKECPLTPKTLIDILDRETRGNPVDS